MYIYICIKDIIWLYDYIRLILYSNYKTRSVFINNDHDANDAMIWPWARQEAEALEAAQLAEQRAEKQRLKAEATTWQELEFPLLNDVLSI